VPSTVLQGVRYQDTVESVRRAAAALAPVVHSIVILSHLGFDNADDSDIHIIPALRNSKVSVILGGHSHEALDPAYVIDGITACNAGAHGVNVNKVTLARNAHGSIEVRAKLLPQDHRVPDSERLLAARTEELKAFLPLQAERVPLPPLVITASKTPPSGAHRDRELTLLTAAMRASDQAAPDGIQMVPFLYLIGQLPEGNNALSHLDVLTAYPNTERLMEIHLKGSDLKQLIGLQTRLNFYYSALPVWLRDGHEVSINQLDDERSYGVIVSELASEGGLGWTILQEVETKVRPLDVTCADLVWNYLSERR
jgi:2',3'-cyclic-nucleotide 2'-phosphodiesterase (5'-nucleotidase family)